MIAHSPQVFRLSIQHHVVQKSLEHLKILLYVVLKETDGTFCLYFV